MSTVVEVEGGYEIHMQTGITVEVNNASGSSGTNGVGIENIEYDGEEIVIEMTDETIYGPFQVRGLQGEQGPQGEMGFMGPAGPTGPQGPAGTTDHSLLLNLNADDHTQYLNLNGRAGGQTISDRLTFNAPALTGSAATSILNLNQTWNTTGNPNAIFLNITNTASGASSNLMDLQANGVSHFRVSANSGVGFVAICGTIAGSTFASGGVMANTSQDMRLVVTNAIRSVIVSNDYSFNSSPRAIFEVKSTTKGLLPPRMTTTQRNAIATVSGDAGLTIFNTTTGKLEVYDGTTWQQCF